MTTLTDEIRDLFLRLFKLRWAFYIAALLLFIKLEGGEVVAAFDLPFEEAIISLSGKLFILLTLWFASNAIFYLSQLPKLREALNKAEQMLHVQAFYPSNYLDLPEGIKDSVRKYVGKSIKQINEHGTPLIVCSDSEHFKYYKNFAFNAEKIYGTATRSPFYYASELDIKSYINFFKQRNVTRVTILDKNTIEHIIARNIFNIHDGSGTLKNGLFA